MRQEAFESGYGCLGLRDFVACVQSYKKDSPSSGLFGVKVYNEHGMAERNGTGMFPREIMKRFPLLPLKEEGRLNDMPLRENFIERVFAYYRWAEMLENSRTGSPSRTAGPLVRFHTAHKLTLMAHSPKHYTEIGRLVADAGRCDWEELTAEYGAQLMLGLAVMGTRGKHVNVLQHLMGYLKKGLSSEGKAYLRYVGAPGPHRGLPAGHGTTDRAADAAQTSSEPASGSRLGAPAGLPASVSQGAHAAQSCIGLVSASHLYGILYPKKLIVPNSATSAATSTKSFWKPKLDRS